MQSLFETTVMFLVADNWPVMRVNETNTLHMRYQGEHGIWTCIAQTLEEQRMLLFYSICPHEIPAHRYGDVMEFITRANYGMLGGGFEFDLSDGDLRYRTSITIPDSDLTTGAVRHIVYNNVTSMDTYLPGIVLLLTDQAIPEEAVAHVEAGIHRADQ